MRQIKKILIANRGEIALRIMRTAKEMGIATVAVFSEADRQAPHVRFADEAVCIGPALSSQSYLLGDKIIKIAKKLNVDAIHPGYGFLSENAGFSKATEAAGILFVGPSHKSIDMMGSKIAAKQAARSMNVPLVPGVDEAITDRSNAKIIAQEVGYPILIKASAGGGGKGMRVVMNEAEFDEQMDRAVSEAIASFGDGSVFIEKYIIAPKHIEIQILGDKHGNIVHLFERDCSVQRRHQKVVEEAPSSILTPEVREAMGQCAIAVAKACDYYGAGTVEFIVDEELNYYFLEMNTRLQVEHPVTELITGIDLVKQMIWIAEGKALPLTQKDLKILGHAIEIRVCAEDPKNNFLPNVGTLTTYRRPQGNGVRVDDGMEEGMTIPIYYDPMIAKLITYGENRTEAIEKMIRAIDEYQIVGVETTLEFCKFVMKHEAFIEGKFDTRFISLYFSPEKLERTLTENEQKIAALLATYCFDKTVKVVAKKEVTQEISNWKRNRLSAG